jgi:hypothetical protein
MKQRLHQLLKKRKCRLDIGHYFFTVGYAMASPNLLTRVLQKRKNSQLSVRVAAWKTSLPSMPSKVDFSLYNG